MINGIVRWHDRLHPFNEVQIDIIRSTMKLFLYNGIIKGYSETELGHEDNIAREQIAAIMFRYAQYKGIDESVGENTNILSL